MKVLLATHAPLESGGGEERMLLEMIRWLEARGVDITIANFAMTAGAEGRLSRDEVARAVYPARVEEIPASPLLGRLLPVPSLGGLKQLSRLVHSADVVVFGQYYFFDITLHLLARINHRPLVCSQANSLFRPYRDRVSDAAQEGYARLLGWRLLAHCDAIRVCNQEDLQYLRRKCVTSPYLVYPTAGEPEPPQRLSTGWVPVAVRRLQSDGNFRILVVGRMTPQKGVDLVTAAIRILSTAKTESVPKCTFYFAGSDRLPRDLEALANRQPSLVTNLGVLSKAALALSYESSDLVLMPSRYESFGMVAAEAQAFGRPILVSNVTGLREIVDDGRTGFILRDWRATSLAAELTRLAALRRSAPQSWEGIGNAARARYRAVFSSAVTNGQMEEFYAGLGRLSRGRVERVD